MKFFQLDGYFDEYRRPANKATPLELTALITITLIGCILHFWGLGSTGLHGDEETMAMPVRSIVENGVPLLPSDMFYSRGLSQLYAMAASVMVFGESEWSLRLPSALFGSMLPIVAWLLARRFLTGIWSLMFVLVMTLLPETVEAAQTARFYIFYFMIIMLFVWQIHRWGESLKVRDLLFAALLFLIGLDFQALMVFSLAAFALPMCIGYNKRKFLQGILGIGLCLIAFIAHWAFTSAMYDDGTKLVNTLQKSVADKNEGVNTSLLSYLLPAVLVLVAVSYSIQQAIKHSPAHAISVAMLLISILFVFVGPVSAAFYFLALGGVLYIRHHNSWYLPVSIALLLALLLTWEISMVGWDVQTYFRENTQMLSLWPWFVFLGQFPLASLIVISVVVPLIIRFVTSEKLPYGMATLLVLVALPITVISMATWYPPPRYMFGFLPFFILASFQILQYWGREYESRNLLAHKSAVLMLGVVLCISFIRPPDLFRTVNKGCATIANICLPVPDHRAQSEFMKNLDLRGDEIVIAEDVLQQTYYLGGVDYWLLGQDLSAQFVREKDGEYIDIYTSTPTILNGKKADALFGSKTRPDIYLIGNPENSYGNRADHLTNGLFEAVNRWPHHIVYRSENDSARIWLYPANSGD